MKTIAVNIEKGGAGKTTIACHLAWHLADAGHRVLVLDLDRQCNASTALRDFESHGSCKQLFEEGFVAPAGRQRGIYSNRMTGEFDADFGKALSAFRTSPSSIRTNMRRPSSWMPSKATMSSVTPWHSRLR